MWRNSCLRYYRTTSLRSLRQRLNPISEDTRPNHQVWDFSHSSNREGQLHLLANSMPGNQIPICWLSVRWTHVIETKHQFYLYVCLLEGNRLPFPDNNPFSRYSTKSPRNKVEMYTRGAKRYLEGPTPLALLLAEYTGQAVRATDVVVGPSLYSEAIPVKQDICRN